MPENQETKPKQTADEVLPTAACSIVFNSCGENEQSILNRGYVLSQFISERIGRFNLPEKEREAVDYFIATSYSVGDGYSIGELESDDIGEGECYEVAPEEWSEDARFFVDTPTESYYGLETSEEALREYVSHDESVILEWIDERK